MRKLQERRMKEMREKDELKEATNSGFLCWNMTSFNSFAVFVSGFVRLLFVCLFVCLTSYPCVIRNFFGDKISAAVLQAQAPNEEVKFRVMQAVKHLRSKHVLISLNGS